MKTNRPDVTLGDVLVTRDNSLNFVRLIFAASVIFGHSWITGGFGPDVVAEAFPFDINQVNAVDGFFVISGYLIAGLGCDCLLLSTCGDASCEYFLPSGFALP